MNNEEKILQMLTSIQVDVSTIKEDVSDLKTRATKLEMNQENRIIPSIKLLAEGHTMIQDRIDKLSVVDAMRQDIDILKAAVSHLSQELASLKDAM